MHTLLKILVIPAAFGLMGGVASAAPGNVGASAQAKTAEAGEVVTQVRHGGRHWRKYRHSRRHYNRNYYPSYRYRYQPSYRRYNYRPYQRYQHRRYQRPGIRFHFGIGS